MLDYLYKEAVKLNKYWVGDPSAEKDFEVGKHILAFSTGSLVQVKIVTW